MEETCLLVIDEGFDPDELGPLMLCCKAGTASLRG
jgi:hypothetical protein